MKNNGKKKDIDHNLLKKIEGLSESLANRLEGFVKDRYLSPNKVEHGIEDMKKLIELFRQIYPFQVKGYPLEDVRCPNCASDNIKDLREYEIEEVDFRCNEKDCKFVFPESEVEY